MSLLFLELGVGILIAAGCKSKQTFIKSINFACVHALAGNYKIDEVLLLKNFLVKVLFGVPLRILWGTVFKLNFGELGSEAFLAKPIKWL